MEWATATAGDVDAGTEEQLCLLPIGCLEPHGRHLPTGNDALIAHRWALMVAECEPVVVLPPLYYAYVKPGRHLPGTVSLDTTVLLSLLENICDEVARNGYRKILLLNCHGGNDSILDVFRQHVGDGQKAYAVYLTPAFLMTDVVDEIRETGEWGHACEIETSLSLYLFPELCHMERVPDVPASSEKTYDIGAAKTPIDWYATYPHAYVGDARKASAEKGRRLTEEQVRRLVQVVRKIKQDEFVLAAVEEYNRKAARGFGGR